MIVWTLADDFTVKLSHSSGVPVSTVSLLLHRKFTEQEVIARIEFLRDHNRLAVIREVDNKQQ